MPHDLAFLHTAQVHVETFSRLLYQCAPDLSAHHLVEESLLDDARAAGGITPSLAKRIQETVQDATTSGAKVVVCTCSTIGGIAEEVGQGRGFISMRIDRAMADVAVRGGKPSKRTKRILIAAALPSTLLPTRKLLEDSARKIGAMIAISDLLIEAAWAYFEAGNVDQYQECIATTLMANWKSVDVVVLAQASMAYAVERCSGIPIPIVSSPQLGVQAAVAACREATL